MTKRAGLSRLIALAAVVALSVWGAVTLLGGDDRRPSPLVPAAGDEDPFAYDPGRQDEFTRRAAAGLSHVLYAKSPGGVVASAERVARYRELVEGVAEDTGFDPDTIEGDRLPGERRAPGRDGVERPARRGRPDADPRRDRPEPAGDARRPGPQPRG